jgi:hypothetical protein
MNVNSKHRYETKKDKKRLWETRNPQDIKYDSLTHWLAKFRKRDVEVLDYWRVGETWTFKIMKDA